MAGIQKLTDDQLEQVLGGRRIEIIRDPKGVFVYGEPSTHSYKVTHLPGGMNVKTTGADPVYSHDDECFWVKLEGGGWIPASVLDE